MIACCILGLDTYFALFMVLLLQIIDMLVPPKMFYQIFIVSALLAYFILYPGITAGAFALILIFFLLFGRAVVDKLSIYKEMYEQQNERLEEQKKNLNDLKSLMKTLKYTASIKERNRIAARIHDQVGHGISGSIIMLEAALLVMKNDPEKAAGSIQKAIGNLREGVDEIRTALREERADRYVLGINDVNYLLEEFRVN
jgi:signal transduction histidine kinase